MFSRELKIAEQKEALAIVHRVLVAEFSGKNYRPESSFEIFKSSLGIFVTLRKNNALRGCVGIFNSKQTLIDEIAAMAKQAAFHDPRFAPLREDELKDVKIEISILSPMKKVAGHHAVEIGKHGVYLKQGNRSGVFLPQVAAEEHWNKEQFLTALCVEKA